MRDRLDNDELRNAIPNRMCDMHVFRARAIGILWSAAAQSAASCS